ncbi:hypothetical protein QR680_017176 [Steinernema hermaphroditum]|uniref:Uncharacterized protein n=1 Tax=Steinernema hermaphroditum TaxID=289476 RepID=A0AA39HDL1_9BILA|nr:hypothetical protein QR680_017176 [Steinernema hermaphroditum]
MTRRTAAPHKRGRKERLLRYLLRRKPCAVITIVEFSLLAVFGASLTTLVFVNKNLTRQMDVLQRENKVWDDYSHLSTFAHCDYQKAANFNTDFCKSRCGKTAFMWRHHELTEESKNDTSCLDRHEQMNCIEEGGDNYECKTPLQKQIPQCAGLFGVPMPSEMVTSEYEVIAPLLDVTEHIGKDLLAQDIFTVCPRCRVLTKPFTIKVRKTKEECVRKLHTIRKGWPYRMSMCDDVEKLDCNTLAH